MEMEHERPLDPLTSSGMIGDEKLVCQYIENAENKGVWRGDNPLHHNISVLLVQIVLIFIVSRITHFLLRPFHQTLLAAQIVVILLFLPLQFRCYYQLGTEGINLRTRSTFSYHFLFSIYLVLY